MQDKLKINRTILRFRDITDKLLTAEIDDIFQYDVVRDIAITHKDTETYQNNKEAVIYYFIERECGIEGRIFPNDELIEVGSRYDIIIQNFGKSKFKNMTNVDANIYHDPYKIINNIKTPEILRVQISELGKKMNNPAFKLFNYRGKVTGFVLDCKEDKNAHELYKEIKIGTNLAVEIEKYRFNDRGMINFLVKPLEIFNL